MGARTRREAGEGGGGRMSDRWRNAGGGCGGVFRILEGGGGVFIV